MLPDCFSDSLIQGIYLTLTLEMVYFSEDKLPFDIKKPLYFANQRA